MNINYIDIHSHVNFPEYDLDRGEVVARMSENNTATFTVGTTLETSSSAVALANDNQNIFAVIGIHPLETDLTSSTETLFDLNIFEELIKSPKVVAIGECGLDYGRDGVVDPEIKVAQVELFEKQIEFAVKHDKALMLHIRSAHEDVLEILRKYKTKYQSKLRGNVHFFTGTPSEADAYFDLDFSISFTGVITFTHDYDEVIKHAPLNQIMSETDSPFVSPVPFRGKRNEPVRVIEVFKKIAEIKGLDEEVVKKALIQNAVAKFGLVW